MDPSSAEVVGGGPPAHGACVLREVAVGNDDPFKGSVCRSADSGRGLPDHQRRFGVAVRAASSRFLFHLAVGSRPCHGLGPRVAASRNMSCVQQ